MKMIFISFFFLVSGLCHSQKEDYNWYIGWHTTTNPFVYERGVNIFNFNQDPVNIVKREDLKMCFETTCSLYSDKNGYFKYASNGMHIIGSNNLEIENGEQINYNGKYFDLWVSKYVDGSKRYTGFRIPQGMLMLPWPNRDSVIFITLNRIYITGTISTDYVQGLLVGVIDKALDVVVSKDENMFSDSINSSSLQACRHANGRDWWIITFSQNHDYAYLFLLNPFGLNFVHKIETPMRFPFGTGQSTFSPDGKKFILFETSQVGDFVVNSGHLSIFDFDRATGMLSNPKIKKFKAEGIDLGCATSYDGRYLYTANVSKLYQYDLTADDIFATEKVVAVSDNFESKLTPPYTEINDFGFMALAPDGKIYGPGGNTLHMHRIEYPDEEGQDCLVKQHSISTVYNLNTIPNFPNFRLGPLDGSPADTLGLDNHPIAKFRYEADTLDHLKVRFTDVSYFRPEKWTWDFGDGSSFEGKKPYWHTFPKNGVYNVCLTVSNENSSNTVCREVTIGTSSFTNDDLRFSKVVSVFPNPTDGPLLVTLSEYIPEKGNFILYDMMGREVMRQRVYYGQNNLDLSGLSLGTYVYKVFDGTKSIGNGKIVRI